MSDQEHLYHGAGREHLHHSAVVISIFNYCVTPKTNKKTDVVDHLRVADHIGLLFNEPPVTAGLLFN